jgi:predicted O-methyltransferase YrrM
MTIKMDLIFSEIAKRMRKNGQVFTLPNNWMVLVNPDPFVCRPIKYLEIGACCGANAICVAHTYAANPYSELHVIDPWEDYDEYPEYKNSQNTNYESFLANMKDFSNVSSKIKPHKGYSHEVVPRFENEFFDLIFIDGNHQPEYVLEDGVLAFRKLKKGGIMIFDDYNFMGLDVTKRGIDAFLTAYRDRIDYLGFYGGQIFIRKK